MGNGENPQPEKHVGCGYAVVVVHADNGKKGWFCSKCGRAGALDGENNNKGS